MIDITRKDIGRRVIYKPRHALTNRDEWEYGVITGFNDEYVFVCYGNEVQSKSTRKCDLSWEVPAILSLMRSVC